LKGVLGGGDGNGKFTIEDDRGLVEGRTVPGTTERPEKASSGRSNGEGV
jgi:hypothetical protein